MLESSGGIHDAADGGGYLIEAVLDESVLDAVREANEGFLALVAQRHEAGPGAAAFGLPPAAVARIAALDTGGRRAAASCPYTLFNLRFQDAPFWRGVALDPGMPGSGSLADEATLARTAVFLAWHLARSAELTAALALGMTSGVLQAWRGVRLSTLDRAATLALPYLAARWGDHRRFWPKLLESAAPVDRHRAAAARLLGLQLLAAEGMRADQSPIEARPARC